MKVKVTKKQAKVIASLVNQRYSELDNKETLTKAEEKEWLVLDDIIFSPH